MGEGRLEPIGSCPLISLPPLSKHNHPSLLLIYNQKYMYSFIQLNYDSIRRFVTMSMVRTDRRASTKMARSRTNKEEEEVVTTAHNAIPSAVEIVPGWTMIVVTMMISKASDDASKKLHHSHPQTQTHFTKDVFPIVNCAIRHSASAMSNRTIVDRGGVFF